LLGFQTTAAQIKRWSATRPKIALFDPPLCKNQGMGGGDISVLWSSGAYDRTSGIHLMGDRCTVSLSEVPVKIKKYDSKA